MSPPSETKLVHIHTHSALRRDAAAYNVTEGWHAKIGAALKQYTHYDNVACWTVDFDADEPRAFRTDGIEYRVFPSRLLPGTRNRYVNPYIGAADAYVSYPVERSLRSGDCGIISPVEALSCGTPVVSPVLRFIPAEEREAVGALPAEPPAFAGAIEAVLSDPPEQTDCVRTASRHFSWREVAADIAAVYDERL